jgi:FtsP/CotA-like multicopper oxidase with cupredoxin domain
MKKTQKQTFKLNKVTAAVLGATASLAAFQAYAGPGWISTGSAGGYTSVDPVVVPNNGLGLWNASATRPTYYANSPLGMRVDPVTGGQVDTGTPLRKFVDTLPGLTSAGANNLGQYLPVASADTQSYPGADYYEMAVVEYKEQVHSDLPPTGTTFRGYVQIDRLLTNTASSAAAWASYSNVVTGLTAAQAAYSVTYAPYGKYQALSSGLAATQTSYSALVAGLAAAQTSYTNSLTYASLLSGLPAAQLAYNAVVAQHTGAVAALNAAQPGVQTNFTTVSNIDAQYTTLQTGLASAQSTYTAAMAPVLSYQNLQAGLPTAQQQYNTAMQPLVTYNNLLAAVPNEQTAWNTAVTNYRAAVTTYVNACLTILNIPGQPYGATCPLPAPSVSALQLPVGYTIAGFDTAGNAIIGVDLNSNGFGGVVPTAPAAPAGYVASATGVLSVNLAQFGGAVPVVPTVPSGYSVDATGTLSVDLALFGGNVPGSAANPTAAVPTGYANTAGSLAVSLTPPAAPAGYVADATGLLSVDLTPFGGTAPSLPATVPTGYVASANVLSVPLPAGYVIDVTTGLLIVDLTQFGGVVPTAPAVPAGYADVGPTGILSVAVTAPTGAGIASAGSLGVPLYYPNGQPILVAKEVGNASNTMDSTWDHSIYIDPLTKQPVMVQAFAFDKPHYLGPVIVANGQSTPAVNDATPVRMKFNNLLPIGRATCGVGGPVADNTCTPGSIVRNGDLQLPFDTTLIGGGATPIPGATYLQNRVALHLHGGVTPWISDGTPHQWITPVGETVADAGDASLLKGVSMVNVPDMPDPGQGAETVYWTNAQSARLMFWHDHAVAQTRLNVYSGMAAGYLVTDKTESAFAAATGLGEGTPLVFEDKTFVPKDINATTDSNGAAVPGEDAKWRTDAWGQYGDLWYPHVIETNQDPNSQATSFTNPVGRWDYALWFWPVFPVTNALPTGDYGNVTTTPEGFMDTPTVNGTAYPTMTVNPEPTRFRILNAANDRMLNLQLYVADPSVTTADGRTDTEVKMINAVSPGLPDCKVDAYDQLIQPLTPVSAPPAGAPASGPGSCYPVNWPTDGRVGGVPDPSTVGPTIWHIGSEGGLLPAVASEPPVPVNYDYNRRSVTVLNVSQNNDPTQACAAANNGNGACHGLYVGPAERADVVVDFSAFAGKTLIVYNDAPAPNPGYDPRVDYFTGDPDMSSVGSAPTTLPGYGPNMRTLMQIKVSATTTAKTNATPAAQAAFVAGLNGALQTAYTASQDKPLIAEAAYDKAFGTAFAPAGDQFATIFTGSVSKLSQTWVDGNGAKHNYCVPNVVAGTGTSFPSNMSSFVMPAADAKGVACDGPILNKTIQELFDKYGRMNATLGTELPATSANTQTTIPLGYIDPTTETLPQGEVQIWKITHNGVDAHPVHFHLVNVQLLNRVGWDGTLKAPEQGELGWKETIKMNPLEDVIIAVKAKIPPLPGFGLPKSVRALDPSQKIGGTTDFMNLDPYTNGAPTGGVSNQKVDFDWEYVWHCHILGHEENDFMRAFVYTGLSAAPTSATQTAVAAATFADSRPGVVGNPNLSALLVNNSGAPTNVQVASPKVTWNDNSTNEFRFDVQQAPAYTVKSTKLKNGQTVWTQGGVGAYTTLGSALANATGWTSPAVLPATGYAYQVAAVAAGGSAPSATVVQGADLPSAATALSAAGSKLSWTNPVPTNTSGVPTSTVMTACNPATNACVSNTINYQPTAIAGAYVAGATSYTFAGLTPTTVAYNFTITEVGLGGATTTTLVPVPTVPVNVRAAAGTTGAPITGGVTWNAMAGLTYNVQWATTSAALTSNTGTVVLGATSGQQIDLTSAGITTAQTIYMKVQAVNGNGVAGAWSGNIAVSAR